MDRKYLLIVFFSLLSAFSGDLLAWNARAPASSVLVFVSFSMPKDSLRGWLCEAGKINAPVVIRGLINNSFKDTTREIMSILPNNDDGGLQLDPTLFKRFNITKVPAVVVIDPTCLTQESCKDFDVLYGNVTLSYALKKIAQNDDKLAAYANSALMALVEKNK